MKKFVTLFSVFCVLGIAVLGLLLQGSEAGAKDSALKTFMENTVRISGADIEVKTCFPDSPMGQKLLKGNPNTMGGRNFHIAPVNQDCWTVDEINIMEQNPEGEWYFYTINDMIFFVDKVKIPIEGLPNGFALDQFIWKCRPIVNRPYETITVPVLFVDDIYFGPIENPTGQIQEILIYWALPAQYIAQTFGIDVQLDWAVGKDFQADLLPDLDGNGVPDVFLEFPPMQFVWMEPDECGANLINFLMGNSAGALVVEAPFDSVPPLPPRPPLPGMVPGEDGETRPWCFWLGG